MVHCEDNHAKCGSHHSHLADLDAPHDTHEPKLSAIQCGLTKALMRRPLRLHTHVTHPACAQIDTPRLAGHGADHPAHHKAPPAAMTTHRHGLSPPPAAAMRARRRASSSHVAPHVATHAPTRGVGV